MKKHTLGNGNAPEAVARMASGLADSVSGGDAYDPASSHLGIDPRTWGYAPRAALEGAAATGGYFGAGAAGGALGSAVGAPEIGALLGMGAYGLAHHLGFDAKQRAANNGRQDPTGDDVRGALPGALVEAGLDTVGNRVLATNALLRAKPVTGAGAEAMGQTAANVGKTAAVNAATGAASDTVNQLGASVGTDKGASLDPTQVANAAASGGLTSALYKATGSLPEANKNLSLAEGDPEAKVRVAQALNSLRVSGDPNDPSQNDKVLDNGRAVFKIDAAKALSKLKQSQVLQEAQAGGPKADALQLAQDLMTNLKGGNALDPSQVESAKQVLPQDTSDALLNLSELNRLALRAGNKPEAVQNPAIALAKALTKVGATGGIAGGLAHVAGVPAPLVGVIAAGAPLALAKVRAMTHGNPVGEFVTRFGTQAPQPSAAPSEPPSETNGLAPPKLLSAPPIYAGPPSEAPTSVSQNGSWEPQGPQQPIVDPARLLPSPPIRLGNQWDGIMPGHFGQEPTPEAATPAQLLQSARTLSLLQAARARQAVQASRNVGTPSRPVQPQVDPSGSQGPQEPQGQPVSVSEAPRAYPEIVNPELVNIRTPFLSRAQAVNTIRRSPEAIAGGIAKRAGTRAELVEGAKGLDLSNIGKAKVVSQAHDLLSAASGASTKANGNKVLGDWLSGFSNSDKAKLETHFKSARSSHGLTWSDSWGHKTKKDAEAAERINAAVFKAKITKAKHKEHK